MCFAGFYLYRIKEDTELPIDPRKHKAEAIFGFTNVRGLCKRFKVEPGKFVIIPCTFDPDEEGEFYLRLFTETPSLLEKVEAEEEAEE